MSADNALSKYLTSNEGEGGIYNPINLNLYSYGGNSPLRYIDPDGNSIKDVVRWILDRDPISAWSGTFEQKEGQRMKIGNPEYAYNSCQVNAMVMRPAFITNNSGWRFIWPFPDEITQAWYEGTMENLISQNELYSSGYATGSWLNILKDLTGKDWAFSSGNTVGSLYENFKESWLDNLLGKDFYGVVLNVGNRKHAVNILNISKDKKGYNVTWSDPLTGWRGGGKDKTGKHSDTWDNFVKKYGSFDKWMKMEQKDKK